MKKLIFLLLTSSVLYASEEVFLSDAELKKKLISSIKDVQVTATLEGSIEFKDCREMSKFVPGSKPSEDAIKNSIECFKKKMPKDDKALANLSDNLGLQQYGLVASKSKQALTEYLSDKMYESLTGVNRKEKDLKVLMEQMKFGKMKMIDQRVFINLYTTQLIKNSLYEVSRFCFENFRRDVKDADVSSFINHWGKDLENLASMKTESFTDTGTRGFGAFNDTKDNTAIYKTILEDLGANDAEKVKVVSSFFEHCSKHIVPLCSDFEESFKQKENKNASAGRGANACLTKAKLQESRRAIAAANKIQNDFDTSEDFMAKMKVELDKGAKSAEFYDSSKNPETSIDNLTNYSSKDLLEGGAITDNKLSELQEKCSSNPESQECEDFIVIDDSKAKAEHDLDLNMRFKKEAELARVRELKDKDLETYLEENGYLELLAKVKAKEAINIEQEIEAIFDARRVAALAEMKEKVGSRQMTEAEAGQGSEKQKAIKKNAQESKEERARLAQVIMFNNIITGNLTLRKKGSDEIVGRNLNVLKKEVSDLKNAKVDDSLFANLKSQTDGESLSTGESFAGAEILDGILGAKPEEKQKLD